MRCPACDLENPEQARYCANCGGRLGSTCPRCQAAVSPGVRFCMSCGAAIAAGPESIAAEPLSAGGAAERRRISVLFVDLENFTTLAESPVGKPLLWVVAIGLIALAVWQAAEVLRWLDGGEGR